MKEQFRNTILDALRRLEALKKVLKKVLDVVEKLPG